MGMTATQVQPTYSSADVCRQTGISYRMLDNYVRQGYLKPEARPTRWDTTRTATPGKPGWARHFTQDELEVARMLATLVALGVSPQQAATLTRDRAVRWGWVGDVIAACEAMDP